MKEKICGIYKIQCTKKSNRNNGIYIGQSVNIYERWYNHKNELKKNSHYNKHFQRVWNKYGESGFTFEIIEKCNRKELNKKEIYWIEFYNSYTNGLNQNTGGSIVNSKPASKETREKISKQLRGRKREDESRGNHPFAIKVMCNGIIFDCIKDCSDYYNVPYLSMVSWMNGKSIIPDKFIKLGLSKIGEVTTYKTINGNIGKYHRDATKIYCNELNMGFDCQVDCIKYIKENYDIVLASSAISNVLNGKYKHTKGYSFKYQDESKIKEYKSKVCNKGRSRRRKVAMIDMETNIELKVFDSIADANEYLEINRDNGGISCSLNGRQKSAFGYKWKYYEKGDK